MRLPLATDWAEVLVPPVWSAVLLACLLLLALLFRKPLTRVFAGLGISRLSILGVDVEYIAERTEEAFDSREMSAPEREELRAFALLSVRLAPLVRDRRILWVDDEPESNETEARLLRRLGVDVENATATEEALERLRLDPGRFDLVISDWTRGTDTEAGPRLLEALLNRGNERPVLLYVKRVDGERYARASELGADGITAEPDDLLKQVLVELSTAG